jgi:hypothetical protein
MRDLAIFHAILTMVKAQQIIEENLFELFVNILTAVVDRVEECVESTQIISAARNVYIWTVKFSELISSDREDTAVMVSFDTWSRKLLDFIWSNFDNTIDVVRHLTVQIYENTIKSITRVLPSGNCCCCCSKANVS